MQQHSSIAACTVHLFSERGLILISTIPATKIDILAGELGQTVARLFQRVIFNIEKSIPCHRTWIGSRRLRVRFVSRSPTNTLVFKN